MDSNKLASEENVDGMHGRHAERQILVANRDHLHSGK